MSHTFDTLGENSRLWIFPLSRSLTSAERQTLETRLAGFVSDWKAHGAPVAGGFQVEFDQFVLVAADEAQTGVGGCSIDGLFRNVDRLCTELGVSFLTPQFVQFFEGETLTVDSREGFRTRVSAGEVGGETIVLDNTITTLGDFRNGKWRKALKDSWHARAFLS